MITENYHMESRYQSFVFTLFLDLTKKMAIIEKSTWHGVDRCLWPRCSRRAEAITVPAYSNLNLSKNDISNLGFRYIN